MNVTLPQSGFYPALSTETSLAKENHSNNDLSIDFMGKIMSYASEESELQSSLLPLVETEDGNKVFAGYHGGEDFLSDSTLVENIANLSGSLERESMTSISEDSVIHLLKWIASGHLSYKKTDTTITNTGSSNLQEVYQDDFIGKASNNVGTKGNGYEMILSSLSIPAATEANKSSSFDEGSKKIIGSGAALSTLMQQASPYLKRRVVINNQGPDVQIIVRDYFLSNEENLLELKSLLENIKRKVPGAVKVTINGHDYGDLNRYF